MALCGESRMRLDSLGWKWKVVVERAAVSGWRRAWCACRVCCSRSFSTCAARLRSSMARGETMVTVFLSFLDCSGEACGGGSKLALDGDGRYAGEVLERVRPRGGASDVWEAIPIPVAAMLPDCRLGVCGKRVNAGDFMGCGEVALRGFVLSCPSRCSILSLMVLSFSSVAWRRSNNDDLVPFGFNTPLNMTLYRSSLMSGMSMLSNPAPPVDVEGIGAETTGMFGCGTTASACDIVMDLMTMGLCFGVFLPATVLLLAGVDESLDTVGVTDEVLRFASALPMALGGSACFLLPNKPNSRLFCVLDR